MFRWLPSVAPLLGALTLSAVSGSQGPRDRASPETQGDTLPLPRAPVKAFFREKRGFFPGAAGGPFGARSPGRGGAKQRKGPGSDRDPGPFRGSPGEAIPHERNALSSRDLASQYFRRCGA